MLTFSTDDLRPHERFDYWCEVRARNLLGVTISLERDARQHFHGRFSALPVGGAVLSQMQASPYSVSRSAADISRASSDSLCIYQQTSGASWFSTRNGSEFVVQTNDIAISHTDVPYLTRPVTAHGFDLRVLARHRAPAHRRDLDLRPCRMADGRGRPHCRRSLRHRRGNGPDRVECRGKGSCAA